MTRLPKPKSIAAAKAEITEAFDFSRARYGKAEWAGSERVAGAYCLRAARQMVADGVAVLVSDTGSSVFIRATA